MNKETILEKSRQESQEKDLYQLSIETKAYRFAFIGAQVVTAILLVVQYIITKEFNYALLIIDVSIEALYNFYVAVKLKTPKAWASAIALTILDIALTVMLVVL